MQSPTTKTLILAAIFALPALGACDGDNAGATDDSFGTDECIGDVCVVDEDCGCSETCLLGECGYPPNCEQVKLSWTSAVEREDGSCLRDIGGYVLHFGQESRSYTEVMDVGAPCVPVEEVECGDGEMVMQYTCDFIFQRPIDEDSTWFMALTTYTLEGLESVYSAEVEIEIACNRSRHEWAPVFEYSSEASVEDLADVFVDEARRVQRPRPSHLY